jgi:hypothetical protein
MSKSTRNSRPTQSRPVARGPHGPLAMMATLQLMGGEEGAWIVCAHHLPTGKRFVLTISAASGDGALGLAKCKAASLDPFTGPDAWQFSVEMYDVDAVVAMQCEDTQDLDTPIPYAVTSDRDDELHFEDTQDGAGTAEDLFWPERAAELGR